MSDVLLGRSTAEEPVQESHHATAPAAASVCALGTEMLYPLFCVRGHGDSHCGFAVATALTKASTGHGLEAGGLTDRA